MSLINLVQFLNENQRTVKDWFLSQQPFKTLPFYNSVDIRFSENKCSVVDTNLFPAGFNNLSLESKKLASKVLSKHISSHFPQTKSILLIVEDHTRNLGYLEHLKALSFIFKQSDIKLTIAAFFEDNPLFCEQKGYLDILVQQDQIRVHCLIRILKDLESKLRSIDLVLLNHDLSNGIPDKLNALSCPILPAKHLGWTKRKKSDHFNLYRKNLEQFFKTFKVDMDPWLCYPLQESIDNCSIQDDQDRQKLYSLAQNLFKDIQNKHLQHKIKSKPYIVLKNNQGTYGMGVVPIHSPEEILVLNRKARNKLSIAKGGMKISNFLLQEGIPTCQGNDREVFETVSYQIALEQVGVFYRAHSKKTATDNLNSPGMSFLSDQEVQSSNSELTLAKFLAQIATLAATEEIKTTEACLCL